MDDHTRTGSFVAGLKDHRILSVVIVLGMIVIAIGSLTDGVGKIIEFGARLRTSGDMKFAELFDNVSQYVIDGRLERTSYSGDVVITPVGLFEDPGTLADGRPTGYTYLLLRLTNTGSTPVTIGALVDGSDDWYRLDDPGFGYRPVATTLVQWQGWFRGQPIDPETLEEQTARFGSPILAATLEAGETKYGYVNSLGRSWPEQLTLTVIDVTNVPAGTADLAIHVTAFGPGGRVTESVEVSVESALTEVPAPRPIVIPSGAQIRADHDEMKVVNEWAIREQENIYNDPSFSVVTSPTVEEVFPWEGMVVGKDSVTLRVPLGADEANLVYQIYGHLHLMVQMGRQEEWLPEAPDAVGYELERAITARAADTWILGRSVFDLSPFGPLDELAYAKHSGYLDAFIFTARPDDFASSRDDWIRGSPGQAERYRRWFLSTFNKEPPGIRAN